MADILRQLQGETFVLSTETPAVAAPQIAGFDIQLRDDGQLEVGVPAGQGLNTLFEALGRHDIRVSSMRNKSNRLEELFIRLVEGKDRKG